VGMNSLISKRDLITKIYFRRENIIIASVISSLITLGLNLLIFAVFMFSAGLLPGWNSLVFLFYLPLLFLFTCGVTFLLATLYARFHDLGHIWEVLLQILFWLTPIVYDLSFVPEQYRQLLYLNPLTQFISYSRKIFLINELPSLKQHLILILVSLFTYALGYWFFKRNEHYIAETI
jgi:ABC-type polysaccharide/polyol phosphate export permease